MTATIPAARAQAKPAQILAFDSLDDRREIYTLLSRLPPRKRVRFLAWVCARAVLPNSLLRPQVDRETWELAELARVDDSADRRLTLEVNMNVWQVGQSFAVDFPEVIRALEQYGRGKALPPSGSA